MAWFEMLLRDADRLSDCARRMNVMPLGAAALAGTSYPLDRHYSAELLDFDAPADGPAALRGRLAGLAKRARSAG